MASRSISSFVMFNGITTWRAADVAQVCVRNQGIGSSVALTRVSLFAGTRTPLVQRT
jgi:hypothetical protein